MSEATPEISFLEARKALLFNFTASSYHWGCYGTSMEIYKSLLEKKYYVEVVDVNVTHSLSPTITNFADFDDENFVNRFNQENSSLILSIIEAEVVVVNGEGTLNRISKGSLNLLFIMYISKKFFNKKVHVINFSCFPNGDASIPTGESLIYPSVLKHMDRVMVRDHLSNKILVNSGVKSKQSFDCLPRFLNRYGQISTHRPTGNILVSGGVWFEDDRYKLMFDFINHFLTKKVPVTFLLGAHASPAPEDKKLQKRLEEDANLKSLRVVEARSMSEWIDEFKSASFLFSARFHHSMAALSIGTPFRFLSSNTPKISAVLETIGEDVDRFQIAEDQISDLISAAEKCISSVTSITSKRRVHTMISLANKNFVGL